MCKYCDGKTCGKDPKECGLRYPIQPCGNGDLGIRACYLDGGIVLFKDHFVASGYFDINYCPMCGRKIKLEENES